MCHLLHREKSNRDRRDSRFWLSPSQASPGLIPTQGCPRAHGGPHSERPGEETCAEADSAPQAGELYGPPATPRPRVREHGRRHVDGHHLPAAAGKPGAGGSSRALSWKEVTPNCWGPSSSPHAAFHNALLWGSSSLSLLFVPIFPVKPHTVPSHRSRPRHPQSWLCGWVGGSPRRGQR